MLVTGTGAIEPSTRRSVDAKLPCIASVGSEIAFSADGLLGFQGRCAALGSRGSTVY
jgi:hypothetical protein